MLELKMNKGLSELLLDRQTVAEPRVLETVTEFGLPGLNQRIKCRVYSCPQSSKESAHEARLSHQLTIPGSARSPTVIAAGTAAEASQLAVSRLLELYRTAIAAGLKVEPDWLEEA